MRVSWIRILAFLGAVGVPAFAVYSFSMSDKTPFLCFLLIFFVFHSVERVWETFYTSRERHAFELHGDWTLIATTIAYIFLCLLVIAESFLFCGRPDLAVSFSGFGLYLTSFSLRWWGMKTLGRQWAVHAVGVQKISQVNIVKSGPYKFIRHPIYLAIFFEVVSIPLIANAWWGMLFAILFYIPLQYKRLLEEERNNVRKMGGDYLEYVKETSAIFPFKYLFKK